ncbi:MAG: tRNA (adenosine(37)-N6)-threonylcarbamoyltransferase complex transferase subunit TsaD [Pseudomonadota bacterium]
MLGIETSCDDTAVAIVTSDGDILADIRRGQAYEHKNYGGVVPEIAARAHGVHLPGLIRQAFAEASVGPAALAGVAATAGPGLIGGVMVGLVMAKAIALAAGKPLIAVNHLEGHALSVRLSEAVEFPYLLLLTSGGHCQFLLVEDVGRYQRLGTTIDDAAGEAFDKTAQLLGLGFPGGPQIEAIAQTGDETRFRFPRPGLTMPGQVRPPADIGPFNLSFSGLKSAVRREAMMLAANGTLSETDRADIAASFQRAVCDCLVRRAERVLAAYPGVPTFAVAGGVAANLLIRRELAEACDAAGRRFVVPPQRLCTDNGAMIAWAGHERLRRGMTSPLDFAARARWPLDDRVEPVVGSGKRGAKV